MSDLAIGLYKIFQTIKEKNLGIIFDTSGSMYQYLEVVRSSIVKLAHYLSHTSNNSQFNVISFSKTNTSFADSVVPCSKENILSLSKWLENLKCDTQTNSLLALVSAFSDENCDGVVVFTDGIPSQKAGVVLKCVEEISDGRPVHVIYVNNGFNDRNVINFWEILTETTYGTFHVLQHTKKDEQFTIYSKGSDEYEAQSPSEFSSDSSTTVGYDFKKRNKKLQSRSDISNGYQNSIRKNILARSKEDAFFYKANIIEEKSGGVFIHFVKSGTKDFIKLEDVINYEEENLEKVYEGDFVLATSDRNMFIPGRIIKKEYIYDEDDDSLDFIKMLKIRTFNEQNEIVPIKSAIKITEEQYKRFTREILRCQIDKTDQNIGILEESKSQLFRMKSHDPEMFSPRKHEEERDFLKDKIEKQLAESANFLKNLSIGQGYEERYLEESLNLGDMRTDRLSQSLHLPKRKHYSPSEDSSIMLTKSYSKIKPPRSPHLVKSWSKEDHLEKKRNKRIRSASVGSNVVERSKKHWIGRPITKETTPKRPNFDRFRFVKLKTNAPVADDYQTIDGVPFPPKTDKKFHQHPSGSWVAAYQPVPPYQHRDIIGHRIVSMPDQPFNEKIGHAGMKSEIREKKKLENARIAKERRKEKEVVRKKQIANEKKERDEQVRAEKKKREEEGYTKVQITIERDRSNRENKLRKIEYWRNFETQREEKNQQKKEDRIEARREKKMNYKQLQDERPVQVAQQRKAREEKQKNFEQSRLEKEIEKGEAKLNRLKKMRESTDARFDSLRKKNDYQRDIESHVNNLNTGRTRAEILP